MNRVFAVALCCTVLSNAHVLSAQQPQALSNASAAVVRLDIPHSYNPIAAYRPMHVPAPNLANSSRIDSLIHNGVLELSLKDAISLALENNLDLAIARYNIPIAAADVLRTRAGGVFRGVNTGVVQNTPGGGVGGFGSGAAGAGAGGTTGGAGGAGGGAGGLVQSTLGTGTNVSSYDPSLTANVNVHHDTSPLSNLSIYGTPTLKQNAINGTFGYSEAFSTGTSVTVSYQTDRETTNSPYTFLNPELDTYYQVTLQQQLLAGFGIGPNLRYLRIAKNNEKISDEAFALQVATTVTQIENMYWDLTGAYEDEQVKQASLDFANQTLDSARKQLQLQAVPAIDVMKDEGEVAEREQDLTIAKSTLEFQELLLKNALTKNLDDPVLEAMAVRPTDLTAVTADLKMAATGFASDAIAEALARRTELSESMIDLQNRGISQKAADNALLPTLAAIGYYGGTGLGGVSSPAAGVTSTVPRNYPGAAANAFNNTAPNYYLGFSLNIPLRNRIAKSDQYRAELETRQAELRLEQLKKQIRIEVRNAQFAVAQSQARVVSAQKARDLAERTFQIMQKEQDLGAGSAMQTLSSRNDLATADSALVAARTAYLKAQVELQRAVGTTLEANTISIESVLTTKKPVANP
jgi:outer membrane protein TolC